MRAYLHRFAPKPADLEDLLQETYTRLLQLPAARRAEIQAVQAFALTTARNVAIDWARRRRVVPIDFVEDLSALSVCEEGAHVDEIVHAHQQLVRIAAAVAELPTRCAEVFTLRRVYGWSQREIAGHFGISVSTVENHLVKAVRRCTQQLSHGGTQTRPRAGRRWFARSRHARSER
ncbi:MAG: RNA polymerase sigma factor [Steroidobacteraceae bacterium]